MRKLYLFLLLGLFVSCFKSDFDYQDINYSNELLYLDGTPDFVALSNDPFEIIGITPGEYRWEIIIEYTGGCEDHQFTLSKVSFSASQNLTSFNLFHDSNEDPCEAVVTDTLFVDFDLLRSEFSNLNEVNVSIINANSGKKIVVDTELARIPQSTTCNLEATFENSLCGLSIWQNNFFKLADTSLFHENIWIQPIKAINFETSNIPEAGSYQIGITLVFGYEYQLPDSECQTFPQGVIIPATLNCFAKK